MEKKLYYSFSDNCDYRNIILELSGVMEWIAADNSDRGEDDDLSEIGYTIKPVFMTEEEFQNLPEAD